MPGSRKASATSPLGKEETEQIKRVGMRKVRVICTDPDATESSSDEQDEELRRGSLQKRVVREMLIPTLVSSQEAAEEGFYGRSLRDSKFTHSIPHSSSSSALPCLPHRRNLSKNLSKSGAKKWRPRQVNGMSISSGDFLPEIGKKVCRYVGVRQRKWGKWTAELREPSQGLRMWLGTFDSAKEAAVAYDEAAIKLKGAGAITNFGTPSPSSNLASLDVHMGHELGNLSSESWPSVDMCADDSGLLLSCADLEAVEECLLAYSPSSVLDPSISSDSGLLISSPSSMLENALTDDCASAPFQASDTGVASGNCLEECNSSRHIFVTSVGKHKMNLATSTDKMDHQSVLHEPLLLEEPFFEAFGEWFDCENSKFASEDGLARQEGVSFENRSEEEAASLMSFDLDAEALTWINLEP